MAFCKDCNTPLCEECKRQHQRNRTTLKHEVNEIGSNINSHEDPTHSNPPPKVAPEFTRVSHNPWKCELHKQEEVEMYCKDCDEVTCYRCVLTKHTTEGKLHDLIAADKVGEYREKVIQLVKPVEELELKFGEAIEAVKALQKGLVKTKKFKKEAIEEHHKKLQNDLDKQKQQLVEKVEEIEKRKQERLKDQFGELQRIQATLQSSTKFARHICETYIAMELFFIQSQVSSRLEQLHGGYNPHPRQPCDNDIIQFARNEELETKVKSTNAIGEVFADAHIQAFTADDLDGIPFIQGKPTDFQVTCRDIVGSPLSEHHFTVVAEIRAHGEEEAIQCNVVNDENGTYTVTVQPQTHGDHAMTISVEMDQKKVPIAANPYRIYVAPPHCNVTEAAWTISKESDERLNEILKNPWGIVITGDNKIVVSDVITNCIIIFDNDRNYLLSIGTEGKGEMQFNSPRGLAVTRENHVIVAEKKNHRLQEISLDGNGQFVRFFGANEAGVAGSADGQLHGPSNVAVNSDGTVLVTDSINQRIVYFQRDGTLLGVIGRWGCELNAFNEPYAISVFCQPCVSGEGSREMIFVIERQGQRVQCFLKQDDNSYKSIKTFGKKGTDPGQLEQPVGLTVDPKSGYVFIVESNHRLSLFSRSGEFLYSFGSQGNGPVQFYNAMSVAVLNNSHIVVTDCANGRVVAFQILEA